MWGLLPEDLEAAGCPGRALHVFGQLQRPRGWVPATGAAGDGGGEGGRAEDGRADAAPRPQLSRPIRAWLAERFDTTLPAIVESHPSTDGATKLALGLADGRRIEAVHMPRPASGRNGSRSGSDASGASGSGASGDGGRGASGSSGSDASGGSGSGGSDASGSSDSGVGASGSTQRVTYCISSQVGCALGCTFCATGAMGLTRNLSAGEIVGQVLALMQRLGPSCGDRLFLVFMGMGEPLHNLDHVHRAIRILCHPQGAGLSPRRITVSTAGLVPGIERLARMEPRPQLAVSINSTTDAARSATMPINRAWNLARLRQALAAWTLKPNERLVFEYVLLADVNDTLEDADRLAAWLGDLRHRHNLNLIPLNEHPRSPFREPPESRLQAFAARLRQQGCFISVRRSRSRDTQGACGQLAR